MNTWHLGLQVATITTLSLMQRVFNQLELAGAVPKAMKWLLGTALCFGVRSTWALGWTLRERTVIPIAVLS
ncbi:hypothetical protein, partial [Paenibacillus tritici]|uniref:hypothetical protein n=1 Tax=Paenibacillus tritici TaxID=1873425 RepID=UPI001C202EB5